ncbi:MAG: DNA methyltransferase [Acidobacteriota bacterium]|nr:DNA methyltransferase [Acidobacteriota bacterium]
MTDPYYQDDHVTLYHGDCLELADVWTGADVLVTDPPYGVAAPLSFGWKGAKPKHWTPTHDRNVGWDKTLEVRNAMLVLWSGRPAAVFGSPRRLDDVPSYREVPLIWDKGEVGMGDTAFPWRPSYEAIYVSGDGWSGPRTSAILRCPIGPTFARDSGHPSPKPVDLMSAIIAKAPPGTIADPFAGSGSTLVAAKALGRRAIGVELEERYCEIAARRLAQDVLNFEEPA